LSLLADGSGWRRNLEGWQVLAVAGCIAVGAAALALPRATAPRELPLPQVDRAEQGRVERDERAELEKAQAKPLPFLVRAAGDALRRFGRAESGLDPAPIDVARTDFQETVQGARKRHGDRALLDLRAVQTALFVRAVSELGRRPSPNPDAVELGGGFVSRAERSGWIDATGHAVLEPDEAACIFKIRWSLLAGLIETFPFSPSLNDWRLYYRTLLVHSDSPRGQRAARGQQDAALLASYVDGLSKRDPEYPSILARGILAYWAGQFGEATELFAQHLSRHPTGPWRLRAQNYLLAAYSLAPKPASPADSGFF
jgi:hypothetical protein